MFSGKVIYFLLTIIILLSLIYAYILYIHKDGKYDDYVEIISSEQTLTPEFNYSKSVYDLVKRTRLTLPNEANTVIISWKMMLPNIGGEFYWTDNYNKDKPIIRIGKSPHIYYNPKQNVLKVICKYLYSPFENQFPIIEIPDIVLQKWSTYTVLIQNSLIKVYIDGKLVLSKHLKNSIEIDDGKSVDILVGQVHNNIFGKINNLRLYFNNYEHYQLKKLNL